MKYLISIYMWLSGSVFMFWVFIIAYAKLIFLPAKKVFPFFHVNLRRLFKLILVRVDCEYTTEIDKTKPYIVMPNHVSFFDVPLMGGYTPNFTFGIEAASHFKWFLYGPVIRKYGQIPIERNNVQASMLAYKTAAERVKNFGSSIIVFPEGTRSKTGKLNQLKKLPFVLAKMVEIDILPVGLTGMQDLSPKGSFWVQPTKVKVKFGTPISSDIIKNSEPEQLAELVRNQLIQLVEEKITD